MNLLIITQKVDRTDPILGFFHQWIEEFAKHCESLAVIGQYVGEYRLPPNVHVLSLWKERGWPRWLQVMRFWWLITRHVRAYDVVLVHMTPIWVLLGWKVWFLLRKPVYLWYETRRGGYILRMALWCVRKVFSATPDGLPFSSAKAVVTGHGIDTDFFTPGRQKREDGLVVAIGRITRIKRLMTILGAFTELPASCRLVIVGGTITQEDQEEEGLLHKKIQELGVQNRIKFAGFFRQAGVRDLLQKANLLLHAAGGGLDKVILEAMACGCPVVCASEAAQSILPELSRAGDSMARVANHLLALPDTERQRLGNELRARVIRDHSLQKLMVRLVGEMQQ